MDTKQLKRAGTALMFAPLIAGAACVRVTATTLSPRTGAIDPDSVRVFAIDRPAAFTEIALLRSHRFLASDTRVLTALRRRAAALGANGLVLINAAQSATQTHAGTGVIVAGRNAGSVIVGSGETHVDSFERAVAVRWGK